MNKSPVETHVHLKEDLGSLQASIEFGDRQKRRSSLFTESTIASETSHPEEVEKDKMPVTAFTSSNSMNHCHKSKACSTRRKHVKKEKTMDKTMGKKVLIDLISKEMVDTWSMNVEDDLAAEDLANRPTSAPSSADIFYAMMNGENIDTSNSADDAMDNPTLDDVEIDLDIENDFDQVSFHKLAFGSLRLDDVGNIQVPISDMKSRQSISEESASNNSTPSVTMSSDSDGFSIGEIEQFVLQSIPLDVRSRIPKEAWGKIFGRSLVGSTTNPKVAKSENLDDDDVSEITNATDCIAKYGFAAKGRGCPPTVHGSPTGSGSQGSASESNSLTQPASHRIELPGGTEDKGKGKKVSFAIVQIRYYERILDINPSVTAGPAIAIGWRYKSGGKLAIEDWEMRKGDNLRRANELLLPKHVREAMLKEVGFTQRDIAEAVRVIIKAKNKRKQTVQNLGAEAMEEAIELAARRVKGILSFGKRNGLIRE